MMNKYFQNQIKFPLKNNFNKNVKFQFNYNIPEIVSTCKQENSLSFRSTFLEHWNLFFSPDFFFSKIKSWKKNKFGNLFYSDYFRQFKRAEWNRIFFLLKISKLQLLNIFIFYSFIQRKITIFNSPCNINYRLLNKLKKKRKNFFLNINVFYKNIYTYKRRQYFKKVNNDLAVKLKVLKTSIFFLKLFSIIRTLSGNFFLFRSYFFFIAWILLKKNKVGGWVA